MGRLQKTLVFLQIVWSLLWSGSYILIIESSAYRPGLEHLRTGYYLYVKGLNPSGSWVVYAALSSIAISSLILLLSIFGIFQRSGQYKMFILGVACFLVQLIGLLYIYFE